ncbi:hypothetical protein EUA06_09805 [Nocardioides glacieisoli]|jgi:hypothetical protein|uniref:Uncharacterized protein n=1 Tax=Nocardioides glacieisoli TaxID=1168730 RepID=A0A4Q2RTB7_9ACTN|nr:hypothetical protein [Nocardioides glacieisoli]RYB90593.1 hypothetical protein EUA06_09805 [Nocardioides glacieisoli]
MDERPTHIEGDQDGTADDGSTGVAAVDQVLADVAAVSGTPVAGHVAVFERAHDQLRRALDAVPEPRPDLQQGA